jgi:hypothetical protein
MRMVARTWRRTPACAAFGARVEGQPSKLGSTDAGWRRARRAELAPLYDSVATRRDSAAAEGRKLDWPGGPDRERPEADETWRYLSLRGERREPDSRGMATCLRSPALLVPRARRSAPLRRSRTARATARKTAKRTAIAKLDNAQRQARLARARPDSRPERIATHTSVIPLTRMRAAGHPE